MDNSIMIHDFTDDASVSDWRVVDDVVMGGRSDGAFTLSDDGHGLFSGKVSLENNGGFSSVRQRVRGADVEGRKAFVIRLRGDGKNFQFRAKSSLYQRHSYIGEFETTGEWQEIIIDISDMYPAFRGRKLRMPQYPADDLAEIAFLIGNKKAESFRLEIDWIKMK